MTDLRPQLEPLIRERGLNELARATGISTAAISLWLSGQRSMPAERVRALIDAMIAQDSRRLGELRALRRRLRPRRANV